MLFTVRLFTGITKPTEIIVNIFSCVCFFTIFKSELTLNVHCSVFCFGCPIWNSDLERTLISVAIVMTILTSMVFASANMVPIFFTQNIKEFGSMFINFQIGYLIHIGSKVLSRMLMGLFVLFQYHPTE